MGRVIFVTAFKGGVGKTTASAGIACALAALGKKVCILDADFGMRCMDLVLGAEDRALYDCSDVLSGGCALPDALVQVGETDRLFFLPAPIRYDGKRPDRARADAMFASLRQDFDFCIVDSSAELTDYYRLFADEADEALIVTLHRSVSIRAAEKTAAHLASFGHHSIRLLINCFRSELMHDGRFPTLMDVITRSSVPLLGVIPYSERIPAEQEESVTAFSGKDRRRLADYEAAFLNIACRLCGANVPLMQDVPHPKRKRNALSDASAVLTQTEEKSAV